MQLNELYSKLNSLESQKQAIEQKILETKQVIEKLSPFSKQQKISLFRSLFIAREDVYPTYWISKDGTKKGYSPAQDANIILSTSGYIGEGIDFAHLDTIVFTMPISYQGRIVQYLGRVGRRGQNV